MTTPPKVSVVAPLLPSIVELGRQEPPPEE